MLFPRQRMNLILTHIVLTLNLDSHTTQHERQKSKEMKMVERLKANRDAHREDRGRKLVWQEDRNKRI